jgi:hypothetical protein
MEPFRVYGALKIKSSNNAPFSEELEVEENIEQMEVINFLLCTRVMV